MYRSLTEALIAAQPQANKRGLHIVFKSRKTGSWTALPADPFFDVTNRQPHPTPMWLVYPQ